ncbi:MAG TPA: NADH-quinone oxidoreductase subunit NuoB [Candidatus Omnitrophota bacterium]|nr:NADH-quinone oxidoreductase subunit NuoB [Candidatus Omnitrophota bacterium]
MGLKEQILSRSIYVFHLSSGSCNNCDIEILDCLTPRYDLERFGVVLVGSIKHADAILCTGSANRMTIPRIKKLYEQMPKPGFVIAWGACGSSRGLFKDSYNTGVPIDEIIPVDAYIPGCPPKPEAVIAAISKLVAKIRSKKKS